MKSMLIAAVAAFAFLAPAFGEEAHAAALNAHCCCGKPVDAAIAAVTVKVGEAEHKIAVCSKECAEAVGKMDPKEALKAVEAHNKKTEANK